MTYYYMLMASLPRHGRQYKSKEELISKLKLEKRLALLKEPDRLFLNEIIFSLWESWFDPKLPFSETLKRAKPALESKDRFIKELMIWFFNVRSIFAALRLRKQGGKPPLELQQYWQSSWDAKMIKNWDKPDFGLNAVFPWLKDTTSKLDNQESAALEDLFLSLLWKHLDLIEDRHYFDFEAVILYLLRWNIVNYWSKFSEQKGQERIQTISEKTIKEGIL